MLLLRERTAVDQGAAATGEDGDGRRRRPRWLHRWEVATAADGAEEDGCGTEPRKTMDVGATADDDGAKH